MNSVCLSGSVLLLRTQQETEISMHISAGLIDKKNLATSDP